MKIEWESVESSMKAFALCGSSDGVRHAEWNGKVDFSSSSIILAGIFPPSEHHEYFLPVIAIGERVTEDMNRIYQEIANVRIPKNLPGFDLESGFIRKVHELWFGSFHLPSILLGVELGRDIPEKPTTLFFVDGMAGAHALYELQQDIAICRVD